MIRPNRIAAGGIILRDDSILLVRYRDADGGTYLVGPGGGLEAEENALQAVVREAAEETGLTVQPRKVLAVENLICSRYNMCKIWVLCEVVSGNVHRTEGARAEGIVEAGWYTRDLLTDETVFPPVVKEHHWKSFLSDHWQVVCLPTRRASF